MAKLTPKQAMFCKEYLVDLNATQAAIRSNYSKKTAGRIGQQNLQKVDIQAEIQKMMDKRADKVEITADKVLTEISKMAFANMMDYMTITEEGEAFVDLSKLTREQAAALSEVTVDSYFDTSLAEGDDEKGKTVKKIKIKLSDKKGNLELLGKHLKLFIDQKETKITGEIIHKVSTIDLDERISKVDTTC